MNSSWLVVEPMAHIMTVQLITSQKNPDTPWTSSSITHHPFLSTWPKSTSQMVTTMSKFSTSLANLLTWCRLRSTAGMTMIQWMLLSRLVRSRFITRSNPEISSSSNLFKMTPSQFQLRISKKVILSLSTLAVRIIVNLSSLTWMVRLWSLVWSIGNPLSITPWKKVQ
jgi:hypothetical protein